MQKKKMGKQTPLFMRQAAPKEVKRNMQEVYSTRQAYKEKQKALLEKQLEEFQQEPPQTNKTKSRLVKEVLLEENNKDYKDGMISVSPNEVQEKIAAYDSKINEEETTNNNVKQPAFRRLKSFRDMTIDEKIFYLINFPKQLPPVACVIFTSEGNYRGFIVEKLEKKLHVKMMDGSLQTISLTNITDIKMVGI